MQSLSFIPSVSELLDQYALEFYKEKLSFGVVSYTVKNCVETYKKQILQKKYLDLKKEQVYTEILEAILNKLDEIFTLKIQPVVNATGIGLHTNLGRSPLVDEIWKKIQTLNTHYSSLELNLATGKRGARKSLISQILVHYLGISAEKNDVLVVNNNAAAVFLLLSSLPKGKEVIVSRGEQIQIGGGFRIPEILEQSGLILKEVGTTNITTLEDYKKAINENTAMILKVHTSNFEVVGFTRSVETKELAQICPPFCILAVDQGSGLVKEDTFGEITVSSHLKQGAHVVLFSGDKMLGGPQAGIAIGNKDIIRNMEKHPLMRALRVGKTISSYLEEHLIAYTNQNREPVAWSMMSKPVEELKVLAVRLQEQFSKFVEAIKTQRTLGGGTTPGYFLPSYGIKIKSQNKPEEILKFFRSFSHPILGYIQKDEVVFDLSTLLDGDIEILSAALAAWAKKA